MVKLEDVHAAAQRLSTDVHRSPMLPSRLLGERAGGKVLLKAECLQRAGAFKIRGALNAVRALEPDAKARGVTTFSSGNHGQALALAAKLEGTRAVVFMPENAPRVKVEATRGYGAEVRFAGVTSEERRAAAEEAVEREGFALVAPFDDPRIVAGQGTVGLEILEQAPRADVVLVPVGGGGLIAGISVVLRALRPDVLLWGVEPVTADKLKRALEAGEPVRIPPPRTLADGLCPLEVGRLPFSIVRDHVAGVLTVGDDALREAMRFLALRARLIVEPSGAATAAALIAGALALEGKTAVCVLSGGNVDPALLAALITE